MQPEYVVIPIVFSFFSWFVWMAFSTIRRFKIAKLQAEVQTKLLEESQLRPGTAGVRSNRRGETAHRIVARGKQRFSVYADHRSAANLHRDDLTGAGLPVPAGPCV